MAEPLYQILGSHRNAPLPERKPSWLKVRAPGGENYVRLRHLMREKRLPTRPMRDSERKIDEGKLHQLCDRRILA